MIPLPGPLSTLTDLNRRAKNWLLGWWQLIYLGAVILVLLVSPSSYGRQTRPMLAAQIYRSTAPILWGFTLMCSVFTVVITRIVIVTALSYGLSQYALQVVVRVLVLELIPLTAALFVALRSAIASGTELSMLRQQGELTTLRERGIDPIRNQVLPRVMAGIFSTITLAALSCVVALVMTYLAAYGFSLTGLAAYTRLFGQVFNPAVSLIFIMKTLFFSLAVSLIPMASALYDTAAPGFRANAELRVLVRMFAVILLIEVVSLVGNYY